MKQLIIRTLVAATALLAACSSATSSQPDPSDFVSTKLSVTVHRGDGEFVLHNGSSEPVHYILVDTRGPGYYLVGGEDWPALAPGADAHVAFTGVLGYGPWSTEAIAHLWTPTAGIDYLHLPYR
jgi:hypothetical protein